MIDVPQLDRLITLLETTVGKIDDVKAAVGRLETALEAAEARIAGDVEHNAGEIEALRRQVADLQAQVEAGGLSDAEVAEITSRLDAATARLALIDPDPSFPPPAEDEDDDEEDDEDEPSDDEDEEGEAEDPNDDDEDEG